MRLELNTVVLSKAQSFNCVGLERFSRGEEFMCVYTKDNQHNTMYECLYVQSAKLP